MALPRTLGLTGLTFYGVGMILGAGIYSVIGAAAGTAGDALWLSFALGAVVALLTGLSYAELTTMFPRAGAEFEYVRAALPRWRWPAVLVGVLLIFSGTATTTTVSLAFGGYLRTFVELPPWLVAAALIAAFTALVVVGLRASTWVNIVFTSIEVIGLVLVIGVAVLRADLLEPLGAAIEPGVLPAAALVFFAFLGFEDIANLAEEVREPERTLPRALLLSVLVTATLYVLVALAVVALVPPEQLAASESPLTVAVAGESPLAARLLGAIALFATANTGLISLIAASRMLYGMAGAGDAPPGLGRLHPRRQTPWAAALVVGGLAIALLPLGGVAAIASVSSFGALVAFLAVNGAVVVLRRRTPDARRPFRVPGAVRGVPVIPVVGGLLALLLATQLGARSIAVGVVVLAAGVVLHLARPLWGDLGAPEP